MAIDATFNPDKPAPGGDESYSIIVADDNRAMAELLATNLRRLGHNIVGIAKNGQEAIELAIKHRPDVIIMDIHMPVVDGIEAAREILKTQMIPIVFCTSIPDERTVQRAADLDIISYLVKPFSSAQLKVAVRIAIAQCRGGSNPGS